MSYDIPIKEITISFEEKEREIKIPQVGYISLHYPEKNNSLVIATLSNQSPKWLSFHFSPYAGITQFVELAPANHKRMPATSIALHFNRHENLNIKIKEFVPPPWYRD